MGNFKKSISELLESNPDLLDLRRLFQHDQISAWLVGGCLRDLLLSRTVVDVDIAVEIDPTPVAQKWAQKIQGRWFWLDADRLQSRVLLPNQLTVDFAPLRAATITGDQHLRDFTINSLALPLAGDLSIEQLIDPENGVSDLEHQNLQFCSARSIADDPLRMLKGIRHAVSLQMKLSDQALQQIKAETNAINCVAGERIRDELGRILLAENPVLGFELLYETGLMQQLFGAAGNCWSPRQSFNELQELDLHIKEQVANNGATPISDAPFSSRSLFLLATFFRSYQPVNLPDLLHSKLRLSRQQQRIILSLQQEPDSKWLECLPRVASPRQKALLVESLGYFPAEQLIYWSICRQFVSPDMVYDLLGAYQSQQYLGRVSDLLDGNQLGEILQSSGKEIGAWQQRIKMAELSGEIDDSAEAVNWLEKQISI